MRTEKLVSLVATAALVVTVLLYLSQLVTLRSERHALEHEVSALEREVDAMTDALKTSDDNQQRGVAEPAELVEPEAKPEEEDEVAEVPLCTKRRTFAILSYYCAPQGQSPPEYVNLAIPNRQQYAARHGYEFVDWSNDEETYKGCTENAMYYRYVAMRRLLPLYDGVFWGDLDSLFLNQSRTLEEVMDPRYDLFITVAPYTNAFYQKYSNNGHLFVRNTPWGIALLDELIYQSTRPCHQIRNGDPEFNTVGNAKRPLCQAGGNWMDQDQGLIIAVTRNHSVNPEWGCKVKYMPFAAFNSDYPWYRNGDLIVHFPGKGGEERADLMKRFLYNSDFDTGVVRYDLDPGIKPEVDSHIQGLEKLDDILKLYDRWNTPCQNAPTSTEHTLVSC